MKSRSSTMKNCVAVFSLTAVALTLAACNGSSGDTPPDTGNFRSVNAIADSSSMNVAITNATGFNDVTFGNGTEFHVIPDGSYDVTLTVQPAASGSSAVTVKDPSINISHNNITDVLAIGAAATPHYLTVVTNNSDPAANMANVEFIEAAFGSAVNIDNIYLLPPGSGAAAVVGTDPFTTVESSLDSSPTSPAYNTPKAITGGSYEIVITNGDGLVLYDSGSGAGVTLAAGQNIQIVLMDSTSDDTASPLFLYQMNGSGSNYSTLQSGAQ